MEVRGPLYDELADIVIATGNGRIGAVAREIGERLRERGLSPSRSPSPVETTPAADGG